MITIREIPYKVDFYWKGDRWRQFIRAKNPKTKARVMCYKVYGKWDSYVEMPLNRKVKPVIKLKLTEGKHEIQNVWQTVGFKV